MTNEEILKTMWPDVDIVNFEEDSDIIFADCWLHDGTFLMHVDKNWLKEEYIVQKDVTKTQLTATENASLLEQAYRKGYYDGSKMVINNLDTMRGN